MDVLPWHAWPAFPLALWGLWGLYDMTTLQTFRVSTSALGVGLNGQWAASHGIALQLSMYVPLADRA